MSVEYKQKNDLPNLYDILGITIDVCDDPRCNEIIQKAYFKKAKVCHPDKHPGRKEAEEIFELLTSAYDILKDEKQRTAYNHKLARNQQSSNDFFKLKKRAVDYIKSKGDYVAPTKEQELSFGEKMKLMDAKHNYDPSKNDEKLGSNINQILKKMSGNRAEQDNKLKPDKLFDDGRFDLKKFNATFDMVHKREDNSIMLKNGAPSAWNDYNPVINYGNFDNLDDIYVDDEHQRFYGRVVDSDSPQKKIRKEDIENIKDADYVDGHQFIDDKYYDNIKMQLKERKKDTKQFNNMKYHDYKADDMCGYGILDQLEFEYDNEVPCLDVDDDNIIKKYEKLMEERNKTR